MFNSKLLIEKSNKIRNNIATLDGMHINKQSTDFILKSNFATLYSVGGNYARQKQSSTRINNRKIF